MIYFLKWLGFLLTHGMNMALFAYSYEIIVCKSTQTFSTTLEEDIKTPGTVLKAPKGRIPVVAGNGSNSGNTRKSICGITKDAGIL